MFLLRFVRALSPEFHVVLLGTDVCAAYDVVPVLPIVSLVGILVFSRFDLGLFAPEFRFSDITTSLCISKFNENKFLLLSL